MPSYRGTVDRPEQAKALAGVVAVHIVLALVILSGLNVRSVSHAVEQLTTIAIRQPPPPPPLRPPAAAKPQRMKRPEGATAKQAQPTEVVVPPPKFPEPSPIPAAKVAGTGTSPASGAAVTGSGTGAGGAGSSSGGGGNGDTSRFTPARLISNIPNFEYRALSATGIPSGLVGIIIKVGIDGSLSNCRIARSSGDPSIDSLVCQLVLRYVRFDAARDPAGRPVAQDITYFPNWRHR